MNFNEDQFLNNFKNRLNEDKSLRISGSENLFYLKKIISLIRKIIKSKGSRYKRVTDYVKSTYNTKTWKHFIDNEYWKDAKNLEEYAIHLGSYSRPKNTYQICLVEGHLYNILEKDFYRYSINKQFSIIKKFVNNEDEIVEIGCGVGKRLFGLRSLGLKNKLEGYELTETGAEVCRRVNKFFKANINFQVLDVTENIDSDIFYQKTVLSIHSLEQMKYDTVKVVNNLLSGQPKQVLHFEPVRELFKFSPRDIASILKLYYNDYQNNLLKTLRKFENDDLLTITHVKRLGLNFNPLNETSFIRWIPNLK